MAKRCGVSKKALELYQKHGLICPAHTDAWTGYRYYTAAQCETVAQIRSLQAVGFTLTEIGGFLHRQDTAYRRAMLENKLNELQRSMDALARAMGMARDMLEHC